MQPLDHPMIDPPVVGEVLPEEVREMLREPVADAQIEKAIAALLLLRRLGCNVPISLEVSAEVVMLDAADKKALEDAGFTTDGFCWQMEVV